MKIKKYSKGQHTYTQWGKTKKIEQKSHKSQIEYNEDLQEFYSNHFDIKSKSNSLVISFFKLFFPSNTKKLQSKIILHYQTAKQLIQDLNHAINQGDKKE